MAKAKMSSIDVTMGEDSDHLERFCYSWLDLHVVENFIWIGSENGNGAPSKGSKELF